MNCSTLGSAKCFSQKEVLAKTVRHYNEVHSVRHTSSAATSTPLEKLSAKSVPADPFAKKLEQSEDAVKGRNKFVRMWQHLISQSNAPGTRRRGPLGK